MEQGSVSFCSMAEEHPRRLDELCARTGQSFFELNIKCAFCGFKLTLQELADFHEKLLCLLYRNDCPYAACRGCLRLSAKCEFELFCRCSVNADILPDILQTPLTSVSVRCIYCYRSLDTAEKFDLCTATEKVYLVRNLWRGPCRFCRKK